MDIIFDFGVVVFTWEPSRLIREAIPELLLRQPEADQAARDIFQGHNPEADWSAFDRGAIDSRQVISRISQRSGWSALHLARILAAVPEHLLPKPASVDLIERLFRCGHRLFYLSNMPAPYADHIDRSYTFMKLFRAGIYSSRVGLIKPEPAIFERLDALRSSFQQPVFIDDSPVNVEAATQHGWRAIQFQSPKQIEQELFRIGALPILKGDQFA
jgi:FMN phosphatase YigB (HAD superfamily)